MKIDLDKDAAAVNLQDENYIQKKSSSSMPDIGRKMEYLLNTGNLVSRSGLDLSQATGFTVVAEKLNFFRRAVSLRAAAVKARPHHAPLSVSACFPGGAAEAAN